MSEHTEIPFNLELARKTDEYEIVHARHGVGKLLQHVPEAIEDCRVIVLFDGGQVNRYSESGTFRGGPFITLRRKSKKCIVFGCTNHTDQGKFVGDLCAPCHHILTTGEVGPTDGILKNLRPAEPDPIPFDLARVKGGQHDRYEIVHNVYGECRFVAHVPDAPEDSRVVVLALHPPRLLAFAENGYCSESSRIFLRRKR